MNAVRIACQNLGKNDLSDCEIFTTCEPCPMCWGAIKHANLKNCYIGVDRFFDINKNFDFLVITDDLAT